MNCTIMENNINLHLDVEGNQWEQGQVLKGTLKITNKSKEIIPAKSQKILLGYADQKKLKALNEDAFEVITQLELAFDKIAPGAQQSLPWELPLAENFYISDKKHSPYLFFGDTTKSIPPSLMLSILPHTNIQKMLEYWQVFFRFSIKDTISTKDQYLEVKLQPPPSKEFARLDFLKLKLRRHDKQLELEALAKLKELTADTTGMKVKLSDKSVQVTWPERKYLLLPGHLNQDFMQREIYQILQALLQK